MTTNPFADRYKTYTEVQLLEILDNKQDYQPLAVDTAQKELDNRQLPEEQLSEARKALEAQQQEKIKLQEKANAVENKIKSVGRSALDYINPGTTTEQTHEKFIKILCALLTLNFIYALYSQFSLLAYIFNAKDAGWDFTMILYFIPFIFIPTATILFWLKKKWGWILLSIYLTFSAFTVLYSFIIELSTQSSNNTGFADIFPAPSIATYIGMLIFFGGALAYICKQSIRNIYMIDKEPMLLSIGVTGGLATLQWWELLNNKIF